MENSCLLNESEPSKLASSQMVASVSFGSFDVMRNLATSSPETLPCLDLSRLSKTAPYCCFCCGDMVQALKLAEPEPIEPPEACCKRGDCGCDGFEATAQTGSGMTAGRMVMDLLRKL
ncbi:hypothetical protein OGATHE_004774 [Ogataea polymorpha]|uniref:Uncharacterized protein n=1 Tax=Ogataea polymorpha TaxID=460523 RepID=A0A9P8T1V3_9ASCO|nr:hypothetical protein OGATHE_004774 [Ogataea polymorpha]